jgi:hypothetical protein
LSSAGFNQWKYPLGDSTPCEYTKFIFTFITAALIALVGQNAMGTSRAGNQISKMAVCGLSDSQLAVLRRNAGLGSS